MNIYIIKIKDKYFKRLIKYHIYFENIKKEKDDYILEVSEDNYQKLLKFKKIYKIELLGYKGPIRYRNIFKKHYLFFIMFFLGLSLIIFLSNIVFKIEINEETEDIRNLILKELENNDLKLYGFVKSYSEKEKIKEKILKDNKDKLEWLEITRKGSVYVVDVERRIINQEEENNLPQNIVAKKNAIILSIEAEHGSIVKKLNDYVKKGEVIVSGEITHKDEVVDLVKATATVYGETWYNVHVSYPIFYYEKNYTGKTKKRFSLTILNKKFNFFDKDKYEDEEITETKIFSHHFLPIKFSYEKVLELYKEDSIYTVEEATSKAIKVAREKILKSLPSDSKILSQKKLKIIVNNSTIDVDVFFKVYENITDIVLIDKKLNSQGE